MCGIAGAFGGLARTDIDATARGLIEELRHRGPDGERVERFGDGFFVHLRLAIIDLSDGGAQPMWSADGRWCITFNGEIYNHIELRAALRAQGHVFATASDTEVLLKVWEAWGVEGLKRCIGMFAFALFDAREQRLYLARDRYGIKPLYVAATGDGVRFASTYAALRRFPDCPRRVNAARAVAFVRHGLLDHAGDTLIHGVRAVEPGTVETWRVSGGTARHLATSEPDRPVYRAQPDPLPFHRAAEELRERFLTSVRLHMRGDVPLGFALSGGIDSAAIVCAARLLEPQAELATFTYVATGSPADESRWACMVADRVGATPHHVAMSGAQALDLMPALVRATGGPILGIGNIARLLVYRAAREAGITVMLNGQGADETFGGYDFHVGAALAGCLRRGEAADAARLLLSGAKVMRPQWWSAAAWALDHLLPARVTSPLRRPLGFGHAPDWIDATWVAERTGGTLASLAPLRDQLGDDVLGSRLALDLNTACLPRILMSEDRTSMLNSVETRVPFLAAPITDFAYALPSHYHIGTDAMPKRLLRAAMKGIVPDAILQRTDKIGFEAPHAQSLGAQRARIEALLTSDAARSIALFDHARMLARWRALGHGSERDWKVVWRWLSLVAWTREFDVDWR